ncbi:MAG: monodechloroaminopyrrolnitrin synthase PrnB family protein [Patescibacteria group bacterium]
MQINLTEFKMLCAKVGSQNSTNVHTLDEVFRRLCYSNLSEEKVRLISEFHSELVVDDYTSNAEYCFLRDFGMLFATLKRYNIDLTDFPKFEYVLDISSKQLDEVPRDTVFTYGPMNSLEQRRTFTNLKEENFFIDSFSEGMESLFNCIEALKSAHKSLSSHYDDQTIAFHLNEANIAFRGMVTAIKQVHIKVPAQIFTNDLRPFFDPYAIKDKSYLAPGGAGMPVLIVDQILWSNEYWSDLYSGYFQTNLEYLPSCFRKASDGFVGQPTIRQLIEEKELKISSIAFCELCQTLLLFRGIHKKVADSNFKLRPDGSLGSGGHTPDEILKLLIDKTFELKSTPLH